MLLGLGSFCPAPAYSSEAAQHFHAGRLAFEAHDYPAALAGFEAALATGMSGPAVHFNIGVVAYRLGQHARAVTAFQEVARTPAMAALAHYNLGLVAQRAGDPNRAARWFARVVQETADEQLRALATEQLASAPQPAQHNWVGYAALAAGYDDNVALVSAADVLDVSNKGDTLAELQLAASAPLGRPWRFDAAVLWLDYQDLDSFDQLSADGAARYRIDLGTWTGELALQLGYTTLDGAGFEYRRTLAWQVSTPLREDWRARARYRFSDSEGLNEFAGLGGRRHELDTTLIWQRAPWDLRVAYEYDDSDYDDAALSASRQEVAADLQRSLAGDWTVALQASRCYSRYDVHSNGEETRSELALAINRALLGRWRLIIRYAYAENAADRAEFGYRRHRFSAGVEATL